MDHLVFPTPWKALIIALAQKLCGREEGHLLSILHLFKGTKKGFILYSKLVNEGRMTGGYGEEGNIMLPSQTEHIEFVFVRQICWIISVRRLNHYIEKKSEWLDTKV